MTLMGFMICNFHGNLTEAGAKALPYIPHRLDEGYGLSKSE